MILPVEKNASRDNQTSSGVQSIMETSRDTQNRHETPSNIEHQRMAQYTEVNHQTRDHPYTRAAPYIVIYIRVELQNNTKIAKSFTFIQFMLI